MNDPLKKMCRQFAAKVNNLNDVVVNGLMDNLQKVS